MEKSVGVIALVVLCVALVCLGPVIFLWSVNSLADAGGASFYIPHTLWNYFLAIVFMGVVRSSLFVGR